MCTALRPDLQTPDPRSFPQVVVSRLPRQHWEALGAPEAPHEQPWPLPVVVQLGKQLAEVLVQTVKMPGRLAERQGSCKLIPVLYHVYSFRSFRQVGRWTQLPGLETPLLFPVAGGAQSTGA